MFQNVNKVVLTEALLPKEKRKEIINDFLKFLNEKLDLGDSIPNVIMSYDETEAQNMKSFGKYTPDNNELRVVMANRNLADILRTIAHEMIHHKQNKTGQLNPNSNDTGSDEENEANALAGVFLREFGKNNPIIFE